MSIQGDVCQSNLLCREISINVVRDVMVSKILTSCKYKNQQLSRTQAHQ